MLKTSEINLLLSLIRNSNPKIKKDINWSIFIQHLITHELMPFAYQRLKHRKDIVPSSIYSRLKNSYYYNLSRDNNLWQEFLNIVDNFKRSNITLLPIKGMDLFLRFYPDYYWRAMSDIDILIKEEDFDKSNKILSQLGYKKELLGHRERYWRKNQCHVSFKKLGIFLEVHWALDFKRKNRILLDHLWRRIKQVNIENRKIDILSAEDSVFSLALHNRRMGRILSLKQILDTSNIINSTLRFDWNYILKETQQSKLQATIYFSLTQAKFFTNAKIPSSFIQRLTIPCWQKETIQKFIFNNTFPQNFNFDIKRDYLKTHFLIYDKIREPICYIINIPYEQFCKFYNLKLYREKTNLLYRMRLIFIPFNLFKKIFSGKIPF
ncbi:MAG: nucleotidyltransferase family protein [Candidatus Kaelpia imicola]|nr:nucleotidyltransferase family protein [Candidatus Kaelpia imicola]